jgi:acyl-coenzyme A thioesterase PaaI-like protein
VLHATLGDAFEGAPGRAHGGIVAALFDEAMGFVLSIACTPAFTGRLSVTYRAPVPLGVPLEFRARLTRRDGRKLLMAGEARHGDTLLAQADSLFVAVDSKRFAAGQG